MSGCFGSVIYGLCYVGAYKAGNLSKGLRYIVVLVNFIIVHPGNYLPERLLGVRKRYDNFITATGEDGDSMIGLGLARV